MEILCCTRTICSQIEGVISRHKSFLKVCDIAIARQLLSCESEDPPISSICSIKYVEIDFGVVGLLAVRMTSSKKSSSCNCEALLMNLKTKTKKKKRSVNQKDKTKKKRKRRDTNGSNVKREEETLGRSERDGGDDSSRAAKELDKESRMTVGIKAWKE